VFLLPNAAHTNLIAFGLTRPRLDTMIESGTLTNTPLTWLELNKIPVQHYFTNIRQFEGISA